MGRTESEIEQLEYKLSKRGFMRDPRPVVCSECGERARFLYYVKHTNLGGRTIEWCHHCDVQSGYTRPGGGDRVIEPDFDIETFLA